MAETAKRKPRRKKKKKNTELNLSPEEVLERFTDGPFDGVFTDGACTGNPGPGGWGFVWVRDNEVHAQDFGHDAQTTNNRMELQALIAAYKTLPEDATVNLYSDSNLCVKTLNEWARNWKRMGWKRKTGPVENLELVKEAYELHLAHPKCKLQWIKAHNGSRWNEYADSLATAYTRKDKPPAFGPGGGGAGAGGAGKADKETQTQSADSEDDDGVPVARCRADTPTTQERIHLNNSGASLMPKPVLDAVREHLTLEEQLGGYEAAAERQEAVEAAYADVAQLINTKPRNIAMVDNATGAMAQALSAIPFQRGDVLLTTRHDYASNQIMALSLARRLGIEVVRAKDLAEGGVDPDSMIALIRQRRPKLVMVTQMPTYSGVLQRVTPIAAACREHGVPLLVDACQTVGQLPVDFTKLGCDFLAATSRKFLRGPRGAGFLAVSDEALRKGYLPLLPDLHGAEWEAEDVIRPTPTARRFENWEFSYALILGMGAAARYANELDMQAAARRSCRLAATLRERMAEIPGVRPLDKGAWLGAITTFAVDGWDNPSALTAALRERRVNSSISDLAFSAAAKDTGVSWALRMSPHYYNTDDEIEAAVAAVAEVQRG